MGDQRAHRQYRATDALLARIHIRPGRRCLQVLRDQWSSSQTAYGNIYVTRRIFGVEDIGRKAHIPPRAGRHSQGGSKSGFQRRLLVEELHRHGFCRRHRGPCGGGRHREVHQLGQRDTGCGKSVLHHGLWQQSIGRLGEVEPRIREDGLRHGRHEFAHGHIVGHIGRRCHDRRANRRERQVCALQHRLRNLYHTA